MTILVRIKSWGLTRNPQPGDPIAWLNLTLADERELDDVAARRAAVGRISTRCSPAVGGWGIRFGAASLLAWATAVFAI